MFNPYGKGEIFTIWLFYYDHLQQRILRFIHFNLEISVALSAGSPDFKWVDVCFFFLELVHCVTFSLMLHIKCRFAIYRLVFSSFMFLTPQLS
jgi:hypothetical protein